MKLFENQTPTAPAMKWVKSVLLAIVLPTALAACGAGQSPSAGSRLADGGSNNNRPANNGGLNNTLSAAHYSTIVSLFASDGMVLGLSSYYNAHGFSKSGALSVTASLEPVVCYAGRCEHYYDISQPFSNASGELRTVKAVANVDDVHGFIWLFDSYNNRSTTPEKFNTVGDDRNIAVEGFQSIGMWVNFAGGIVNADLGYSRYPNQGPGERYYYAKNLTCVVRGDQASCHIIYVKDNLPYDFDAIASQDIVEGFKYSLVKPKVTGSTSTYIAEFLDCGEAGSGVTEGQNSCWILAK